MNRMWALIFVGAGIALLIYGIGLIRDARASASWPSVSGQVISADLAVVGREKNKTTYAPNIVYRYVVNGTRYETSRYSLVPRNTTSRTEIESLLANHTPGSAVTVYYNPKSPADGLLVTTRNGAESAYAIGGVLFIATGLFVFFRR